MKDIFGYIYKINFPNGKVYIGQTTQNPYQRFKQHLNSVNKDKYKNIPLYNALSKYTNLVSINILCFSTNRLDLDALEIYFIKYFDSFIHSENTNGYNCTKGGAGISGYKWSESAKLKLSLDRFGDKNPNFGKPCKDSTKRKISDAQLGENNHMSGKVMPNDIKNKISKALLGEKNHFYGKKHSEESKLLMSESQKKSSYKAGKGRNIKVNGIIYGDYKYTAEALNLTLATVKSRACRGTHGFSYC